MKQFLITVAGVLVGLILFIVVVPFFLIGMIASNAERAPSVAQNAVLAIDLREPLTDQPSSAPFQIGGPSIVELSRRIEAAESDKRIKGLYIRANTFGLSAAHAEEIRDAIAQFRKSGKFVVAHMQSEGFSTSMAGYAAIAGADEVWAQGRERIEPMGVTIEALMLGGAAQKYRVRPEFEQREEFKGGDETYTRTAFSEPFRQDLQKVVTGVVERFYGTIAEDRKITVEQVRAAVASTPLPTEQAKNLKLVDQIGFPEDAEKAALDRAGDKAELLEIEDYQPTPKGDPAIALVTGEGVILSGPEEQSFFGGESDMNSDRIAEAFDDAVEDEDVKAIIFRVNSPGGSPTASDQILAAVKRAQAAGKKVVVSMGPIAASGGYWVSASADTIIASPTTITGSIGIYGGKVTVGETLEEFASITSDRVSAGSPLSGWDSPLRPFTNAERAALAKSIDDGYAAFLQTVSEGREMSVDQVRAVAGGRIWTGLQAKEVGLVDEVGGFSTAVAKAKEFAGLKPDDAVSLKVYPEAKSPIEELRDAFGVSAQAAAGAAALAGVLGDERVAAVLEATLDRRQPAARAQAPNLAVR